LAQQSAQIFCESFADCCQEQNVSVDVQACSAELALELEREWLGLGVNITYDPYAAGKCLAGQRSSLRCGRTDHELVDPACYEVFVGKLKPGETCHRSEECEEPKSGGSYCDFSGHVGSDPPQGVCTVKQSPPESHAKLGEACLTTCAGNECAPDPAPGAGEGDTSQSNTAKFCFRDDGLYCTDGGTCASLLSLGASCNGGGECAGSAFCAFDTHVCTERRPEGGACVTEVHCQSGDCQDGVCRKLTVSADECRRGSLL
jgi:hypothetical protein